MFVIENIWGEVSSKANTSLFLKTYFKCFERKRKTSFMRVVMEFQ